MLKGGAQEGVVKEQIAPVSPQTGGWTESMGRAIVTRGVPKRKTAALITQQCALVSHISKTLHTLKKVL